MSRPNPSLSPSLGKPPTAPAAAGSTESGEVVGWHDEKGYGWIGGPGGKIFFHIRDFRRGPRRPRIGDKVCYTMGSDASGRPCAKSVTMLETAAEFGMGAAALLGVLLLLPLLAIATLPVPLWSGPLVVGLMSMVCYFAYAYDKEKAKAGSRRIPEMNLHFLELLGGWPGAWVAQRQLRHKSVKSSYQFVFWSIVVLHEVLAMDLLLDWRMIGLIESAIKGTL